MRRALSQTKSKTTVPGKMRAGALVHRDVRRYSGAAFRDDSNDVYLMRREFAARHAEKD